MHLFHDLERKASAGGYGVDGRVISRVTVADVHRLSAGLARASGGTTQAASLAAASLRRWMVHGDGKLPPVRGAGYVHANREVWIAFTDCETPALLRGRPSAFAELRRCLSLSANPDYRGHLRVKTNPPVDVDGDGDTVTLRSREGIARLSMQDAIHIDHWVSITLRPRDRLGVLLLPGPWIAG
ncbi:hypothetical protein [Candidatus Poriferisodalis sp.]|uniref:hypothetical protein n=1 Tax=Candidatus Poriferisodalis sp. TaxID=3101277 RepID=UPI003AF63E76